MTAQTWTNLEKEVLLQAIDETSTTQMYALGKRIRASHATYGEGEFIYCKGVASTAIGDAVVYDNYNGATVRTVAASRGPLGIAMSANVASQYGWYQIQGLAVCTVAASFAADKPCFSTSTAGTLDDAVVTGDKVDGAVSQTAIATPSGSYAVIALNYPSMNGNG